MGHTNSILWSIDLLNGGEILVSGSTDQNLIVWNLTTGEVLKTKYTGLFIQSLVVLDSIESKKSFLFKFFLLRNVN